MASYSPDHSSETALIMYPTEGVPKVSLNKFPVEVLQNIARNLDDKSLRNLLLACHDVYASIQDRDGGFWRLIWKENFDEPSQRLPNKEMKKQYQNRKKVIRRTVIGAQRVGNFDVEMRTARIIRAIALEAKPIVDEDGEAYSLNFLAFMQLARKTPEFIGYVFKPGYAVNRTPRELLIAQILLAPLGFDPSIEQYIYGFRQSQVQVYQAPTVKPVFQGLDVNLHWILHVLNFFRAHAMRRDMFSLFDTYALLEFGERPGFWTEKIQDQENPVLGQVWKGTSTWIYFAETTAVRQYYAQPRGRNGRRRNPPHLYDRGIDEGGNSIHTVKLFHPEKENEKIPANWDHLLNRHWLSGENASSRPPRFPIEGVGFDHEEFWFTGWIYPVPPQNGVPGWYRVAMMKSESPIEEVLVTDWVLAFEGVIIPGGQMMVGRWWEPNTLQLESQIPSGPFIYWNIERSVPEGLRGPETGVEIDGIPNVQENTIQSAIDGDAADYNTGMDFLQSAYDYILAHNRVDGDPVVDTEVKNPTDLLFIDMYATTASSASQAYTAAVNPSLAPINSESAGVEPATEEP